MQVLKGTRREITIQEWQELIEKHIKRANDSMECFRRFHGADDLQHLIEDCEYISYYAACAKKVIETMELREAMKK